MPAQKSSEDNVIYPGGSATEVVRQHAAGEKITGQMEVTGQTLWQSSTGGVWRDLLTSLQPPAAGATIPVMTTIAASGMQMPLWQLNDAMYFPWHVPHDYSPGTQVYMHVHWMTDGASALTVRWEFTYWYARGYSQQAYGFGAPGTVVTVTQAPAGQYFHMIAETAAITIANLEPDGLIQCRLRRITNGGPDNGNNIFANQADLHYQANTPGTINRNFPFT